MFISQTDLSTRVKNILRYFHVKTEKQFIEFDKSKLRDYYGCGRKTMQELYDYSKDKNIDWFLGGRGIVKTYPKKFIKTRDIYIISHKNRDWGYRIYLRHSADEVKLDMSKLKRDGFRRIKFRKLRIKV